MPVAVHSNPDGVSCPSGPSSTPVAMHLAMRNGEGAPVSPANLPGNPTLADARRRAVDFRAAGSIFLEDQGRSGVSALIGIGATVASLSTPHRGVVAEHVPSHAQVSTIVGLNF